MREDGRVSARVVRLLAPGSLTDSLAESVERIYVVSFPPEERGPFADLRREIAAGLRRLWVTGTGAQRDAADGFAVTVDLDRDDGAVLLEYLAVDPQLRSSGIGSALLQRLVSDSGVPIVLEVEDPADGDDLDRRRRLDFYRRGGAGVIESAHGYAMPRFGRPGTIGMILLAIPESYAAAHDPTDVQELVADIWRVSYSRSLKDPELAAMLARLTC